MFTTIAAKDQEKWRAIAITSVYIQQDSSYPAISRFKEQKDLE